MDKRGIQRRGLLMSAAATGAVAAGGVRAQSSALGSVQTDNAPKELAGKPMPEPSLSQSSGPIAPGRGSNLAGKVAVVTGAARGIGRAIAVEMAANGADIIAVDIAGPVSPASNAVPATPEELEETAKQIRAFGRRVETVRADIRDIAALRRIADQTEEQFGKIDIVVANAAIQRWKPLLEMEDFRLARRHRQQSQWHREHYSGFRAENDGEEERSDPCALVDAGQARHEGRCELLGVEMGHSRAHEIRVHGARAIRDHGQRGHSWPRRHPAHPLREAPVGKHGRDRAEGHRPDAPTGLGQSGADRSDAGRLAAAGRHFASRRLPRVRRRQSCDGGRI